METRSSVENITHWLLIQEKMTPKKLQKMLYYVYAWGLVFLNESADDISQKVFDANFEAWVHGPVIRDVYNKYSVFGRNPIDVEFDTPAIDEETTDLLQQIMNIYGKFTANELERLTHSEIPWKNARKDLKPLDSGKTLITDKDMFNYYASLVKN
jgi:uncharacterized phage-associated protein